MNNPTELSIGIHYLCSLAIHNGKDIEEKNDAISWPKGIMHSKSDTDFMLCILDVRNIMPPSFNIFVMLLTSICA